MYIKVFIARLNINSCGCSVHIWEANACINYSDF